MTDRVSYLPAVSLEAAPNPLQSQFVQIKDQVAAPGSKATDKVDTGDAMFNQVLAIKPTEGGEGFRGAQAAAQAFMTVPDKAEALAKGKPAFEAAVSKSDSEFISAIAKYSPDYNVARRGVMEAQMKAVMASEGLKGAFAKVPDDKKESVNHMVALLSGDDTSPALKASLRKEIGHYPGLLQNFDATEKAMGNVGTAGAAMEKAAAPIMKAARDEAATRYIYAHAMELGGDKGAAVLMKQDAQDKLNQAAHDYLGKPKAPERILKV